MPPWHDPGGRDEHVPAGQRRVPKRLLTRHARSPRRQQERWARFTHRRAFPTFVLGILSLFLGLLAGIPAIVIGRGALHDIDAARGEVGGRGLVVTGLVLGVVGTFLGTAWLVARWVALH